jgi:ribosome biogenesis GTPase A
MAAGKRAAPLAAKAAASWFPGHMASALRHMRAVLRGVDLVVDVRDARAPRATAPAPPLAALLRDGGASSRPRLVVLAKADLAPAESVRRAARDIEARERGREGAPVRVVASSSSAAATGPLLRAASALLRARAARLSSPFVDGSAGVIMVVGAPNVGKSSLINAMRRAAAASAARVTSSSSSRSPAPGAAAAAGAAPPPSPLARRARVGDAPGVTRQLSGFLLPLPLVAAVEPEGGEEAAAAAPAPTAAAGLGYFDARQGGGAAAAAAAAAGGSASSSSPAAAAAAPRRRPSAAQTITAHVLDTPGISPPAVRSERAARVLALLGCLPGGGGDGGGGAGGRGASAAVVSEERQAAHLLALFRRSARARRELERAGARLARAADSDGGPGPPVTERERRGALAACQALLRLSSPSLPPPQGEGRRRQGARRCVPGEDDAAADCDAGGEATAAAGAWHPAVEDEWRRQGGEDGGGGALADAAALAEALGADPGARDPSGAAGALGRALAAFRSGALGRYSLEEEDDEREEEEEVGGRAGQRLRRRAGPLRLAVASRKY